MYKLMEWIAFGQVGVSSRTMWLAITGIIDKPQIMGYLFDVPLDNDDFSRCLKMVRDYNVTNEQLQAVKIPFPWYAPIIDDWNNLVILYDACKINGSSLFYDRIQELRHECMRIDGYEEIRPGYWQKQGMNAKV